MKVNVKLFARAKDLANSDSVELELPESACVADLRQALKQAVPEIAPLASSLLIAIGNDYANDSTVLDPSKPLACFPPVSGG
ncbi:MAG: hypothetical protein Tsb009_34580 [Planctomycetaceae bacterium]